jgi:hypothetical protein
MAQYGALGEGWVYANGSRNGEFFFRGQVSKTGASIVVTIPLPIRLALYPVATIVQSTAPANATVLSVGAPSGNTFTIYAWTYTTGGASGNPTLTAATGAWVANWYCFGNLTGTTPIENQP